LARHFPAPVKPENFSLASVPFFHRTKVVSHRIWLRLTHGLCPTAVLTVSHMLRWPWPAEFSRFRTAYSFLKLV